MSDRDERLDTLLSLYVDALEPEEAAKVRARVASDAAWRALDEEARRMLGILETAAAPASPPAGLAARTAAALAEAQRGPAPWLSKRLAAAILAIAAVPALWIASQWLLSGPARAAILWKPEETVASGGWFGPRAVVRDTETGEPIEGATLRAFLAPKDGDVILLGEGPTDASGMLASGGWRLPDLPPGEARLAIETDGGTRVEAPVQVTVEARLAASPDRRRVRPGERLRVRALLVTTDGARPLAGRDVEIALSDPRDNRVFLERRTTSRFGLARADFPIDDEAIEGDWTVETRAQGLAHVTTVTVRRDVLPSYLVVVRPDRRWVRPGETFTATISARTFDGQVVRDLSAQVVVEGVGGTSAVLADGTASVVLTAPDRAGPVRIEAWVADAARREGVGTTTISASKDPARVLVLAEAGELVPGVSNRVYLVARRADGGPAGGVTIEARRGAGEAVPLAADAQGVAVMTIDKPRAPAEVISVRTIVDGVPTAWNDVALDVRPSKPPQAPHDTAGSLLLRTDRALVEAGGSLEAEAFSSRERGLVAFDLRLDGRSIAVAGAELSGGACRAKLDVPGGIAGMLTLHASMPEDRVVWADRRVVLVRGSRDLRVSVAADRERYRPCETASLACVVTDGDGRGVPAAVSIVAVDEALLALTGDHGGLVQAWHEQAGRALRRGNSDLDPDAIDDGAAPIAQATAAALRPPTVEGVIAQLKDILPLDEMGSYGERLERLFEGNDLSEYERRRRDMILDSLRRYDHPETADALLHLTNVRQAARTQGWRDTATDQRAEAAVARTKQAHRLKAAVALLAALAATVLLLQRGLAPEQALATLTLLWIGAGIALMPIAGERYGLAPWAVLQAIVLLAQLRVALSMQGGARGTQIGLALFAHVSLALVLTSGQPELAIVGIPVLLIVAAVQAAKRSTFAWLLAGVTCAGLLGSFVVVVIPKSQRRTAYMEAMNDARQIAALLERESEGRGLRGGVPAGMRYDAARTLRPPRLREDFRETLLFAPEVVTDEQGRATVEVPLADSLTGWRVLADAIAAKGGVAEGRTRLDVSLPLSADLLLPPGGVVEGDEMEVRVVLSNHTADARRVSVDLEADGAEQLDAGARDIDLKPNAVAPVDFRVRFPTSGEATLRVTMGDADRVERTVIVHRNARRVEFGETRRVTGEALFSVRRPERLLHDDVRGEIRVERGAMAPALEGLEAMLREPNGCFEQTSSIHYPNVLVLRQLLLRDDVDAGTLERARDLVARGYQRLLGFEVDGSGLFSLYGKAPGSLWLTAYGLMQFRTMDGAYAVDPRLLGRIEQALLSRRAPDGSFPGDFGRADLGIAQTAYVVLALGDRAPGETCSWLLAQRDRVEREPYLCALVSLALRRREPAAAAQFADRLPALAARGDDRTFLVAETTLGWGGSRGSGISVEATALGALALLGRGDQNLAQRFLDAVVAARMPRGDWGSTHATAWALQALGQAAAGARGPAPRTVVEVDGRAFELAGDSPRAPLDFDPARLEASVRARVDGAPVLVTLRGRGFLPWDEEGGGARGPELSVEWDRTELAAGETALATIRLAGGPDGAKVPMVAWGLFAGAAPVEADLEKLRESGRIERFERSGNEVRLYVPDVRAGESVQFAVRLRAAARGTFSATPSRAWEYYRPDGLTTLRPARFAVR